MQRPNDRRCNKTDDATTEEEGSGKERSGDLHLPETDAEEEDTDMVEEHESLLLLQTN